MKSRKLILIAVVLGVLAVVLVNTHVSRLRAQEEEEPKVFFRATAGILPGPTVKEAYSKKLLVAVRDIPASFARSYPHAIEGQEVKGYFSDKRIERAVPAGEFLEIQHLKPASAGELARMIPPGHSRVALPATQQSAVGFLPAPGDVVDVYRTVVRKDPEAPGGQTAEALLVTRGMHVFAVDDYYGPEGDVVRPRGRTYRSIVLSGPVAEVEKIIAQSELGRLTLTLPGPREE